MVTTRETKTCQRAKGLGSTAAGSLLLSCSPSAVGNTFSVGLHSLQARAGFGIWGSRGGGSGLLCCATSAVQQSAEPQRDRKRWHNTNHTLRSCGTGALLPPATPVGAMRVNTGSLSHRTRASATSAPIPAQASSQISSLKPGEEFPKQMLLFEECSRGGRK